MKNNQYSGVHQNNTKYNRLNHDNYKEDKYMKHQQVKYKLKVQSKYEILLICYKIFDIFVCIKY